MIPLQWMEGAGEDVVKSVTPVALDTYLLISISITMRKVDVQTCGGVQVTVCLTLGEKIKNPEISNFDSLQNTDISDSYPEFY